MPRDEPLSVFVLIVVAGGAEEADEDAVSVAFSRVEKRFCTEFLLRPVCAARMSQLMVDWVGVSWGELVCGLRRRESRIS